MELQIKSIAEDLLAGLQLEEASVKVERRADEAGEEIEHYLVEVKTSDAPLLIGKHGDNLNAFEHLLKKIASKKGEELNRKITIFADVDGYRKRKEEEALDLARRRAMQVRGSGNPIKLPPMSGFMRRLIHLEFTKPEWEDLVTESSGEANYRCIIIKRKT